MESFSKSQSGAIQNQEQGSHALKSQWRTLQIRDAAQKKLDLIMREYACLTLAITQKRPYVIISKPAIENDLRH